MGFPYSSAGSDLEGHDQSSAALPFLTRSFETNAMSTPILLASGRFAVLEDGIGFSPRWKKHLGGIARGSSVSWEFGRQREVTL